MQAEECEVAYQQVSISQCGRMAYMEVACCKRVNVSFTYGSSMTSAQLGIEAFQNTLSTCAPKLAAKKEGNIRISNDNRTFVFSKIAYQLCCLDKLIK